MIIIITGILVEKKNKTKQNKKQLEVYQTDTTAFYSDYKSNQIRSCIDFIPRLRKK